MNYRHAFHAGNFADVLKHVVLALCLDRLNAKDKPYRYIDTHAGVGGYDLSGEEARRSPEWEQGVGRLWTSIAAAPDEVKDALAPYIDLLRRLNPDGNLRVYPGSPVIAAQMMRRGDAIRLCELHEESADKLETAVGRDRRVKIERRDGFEALPAYLPPPERRGLVLVDPPFEEGTAARKLDFGRMLKACRKAVRRWPQGTYLFWRPIKDLDQVEAFDAELASVLIEEADVAPDKLLVADLWTRAIPSEGGLAAAGLVILNPPFGLQESLRAAMPWLTQLMAQGDGAGWRLASPEPGEG